MRKLTIRRDKTATLSSAFYVSIADDGGKDLTINETPCRLLGRLPNGGEVVFDIPETETRVYVFETKRSREYTYDMYRVPAGTDDVLLTGRSYFNPATSSSFRFDNNDTGEARMNREEADEKAKKAFKRNRILGAVIGVAAVLAFILVAALITAERPRTFSIEGASITLTDRFTEDKESKEDYYVWLSSKTALCEFFMADPEHAVTADEVEEFYKENYELSDFKDFKEDGLRYFTCTEPANDGSTLADTVFIYESEGGAYVVWFATYPENTEQLTPKFVKWAKTVTIE